MQTVEQFPSIQSIRTETGNWRQFTGDGTPFLQVPNLTKVNAIKIGQLSMPLEIEEKYPADLSEHPQMESVTVPLVKLDKLDNGDAVLVRSVKSNDGVWQAGAVVSIEGEFSDDKKK